MGIIKRLKGMSSIYGDQWLPTLDLVFYFFPNVVELGELGCLMRLVKMCISWFSHTILRNSQ